LISRPGRKIHGRSSVASDKLRIMHAWCGSVGFHFRFLIEWCVRRDRERGEVPDHLGLVEKSTMVTVYSEVVRRYGSGGVPHRCSPVMTLPVTSSTSLSLDRVRDRVGEEINGSSEPRVLSPWLPLPLIWHCATGGHQPCWVGHPRSGRRSGPESAVGLDSEKINSNILPLELISYTLTLNFNFNCFHFYLFHHKLVYRACLIVTVNRR
jgi:hypothetical protein